MGLATVTGNMATGFQRFEGETTIDAYKGTQWNFTITFR